MKKLVILDRSFPIRNGSLFFAKAPLKTRIQNHSSTPLAPFFGTNARRRIWLKEFAYRKN